MGPIFNHFLRKKRDFFDCVSDVHINNQKSAENVIYLRDIGYSKKSDANRVDIFRPYDTSEKYPVIVNIHGGELVTGSKEFNTYFCSQLAKLGFVVFSVEYRKIPEVRVFDQIEDISRAMDFVKEIAPSFDGDMDSVYMIGDEAGAMLIVYALALQKSQKLASIANVTPSSLHVHAVAFISGMFYTTKFDEIGLLIAGAAWGKDLFNMDYRRFFNPEYKEIINCLPPCILISSEVDSFLNHTFDFVDALRASGVHYDHQICLDSMGITLCDSFPVVDPDMEESKDAIRCITGFLNQYRGGDDCA